MTGRQAAVVVVGAGPVGLSLCVGLAHHGVRDVVLIDPAPGDRRESRAFGMWARTCETLRDWGMLDELRERGQFLRSLEPLDGLTGRRLFRFDFAVLDAESPAAGVLIAPQSLTERVLYDRVTSDTDTEILTATVQTVTNHEDGVSVVAQREDGVAVEIRARYLVGCDGAHSAVRHQIGMELDGVTYSTRMVLADVRPDSDEGLGPMRFASRHPGFLAGVRFGDRLWRVMATIDPGERDPESLWPSRLRALFGERDAQIVWNSEFALYRRAAPAFRSGRAMLAGDAAHLISPAGGQGMNSGIQDAENLAWKLAAALDGGDERRLLDSYDTERRGLIVTDVGRSAELTQRIEFGMPTWAKPPLLGLLDAAVRVPTVVARLARAISMLGHHYPNSPLLQGDQRLLGTRLTDPILANGKRLTDHLRGRAAVITIGMSPADQFGRDRVDLPTVAIPQAPVAWRLPAPATIIVRPDRHVGAVIGADTTRHHPDGVGPVEAAASIALGRQRAVHQ